MGQGAQAAYRSLLSDAYLSGKDRDLFTAATRNSGTEEKAEVNVPFRLVISNLSLPLCGLNRAHC